MVIASIRAGLRVCLCYGALACVWPGRPPLTSSPPCAELAREPACDCCRLPPALAGGTGAEAHSKAVRRHQSYEDGKSCASPTMTDAEDQATVVPPSTNGVMVVCCLHAFGLLSPRMSCVSCMCRSVLGVRQPLQNLLPVTLSARWWAGWLMW